MTTWLHVQNNLYVGKKLGWRFRGLWNVWLCWLVDWSGAFILTCPDSSKRWESLIRRHSVTSRKIWSLGKTTLTVRDRVQSFVVKQRALRDHPRYVSNLAILYMLIMTCKDIVCGTKLLQNSCVPARVLSFSVATFDGTRRIGHHFHCQVIFTVLRRRSASWQTYLI